MNISERTTNTVIPPSTLLELPVEEYSYINAMEWCSLTESSIIVANNYEYPTHIYIYLYLHILWESQSISRKWKVNFVEWIQPAAVWKIWALPFVAIR